MEELRIGDWYGRKLIFGHFAGQIIVTPIVDKIGDTIGINDDQAKLLLLFLKEHFD